jgi:hypothetical protein
MCCLVQPRFTLSIRTCASPSTRTSLGDPRWLPASCDVFHHAQAKQVEVEIRHDDEFRLRVRDDGKGIDAAVFSSHGLQGHYGLRGMRERATLIKGKLAVWNEVNEGTEVELRVLASTAYTTDHKSSWLRKFAPKEPGNHIICYQAARR